MNRSLGQIMTPVNVAQQMCELIRNSGSILEPSCGTGVFLDLLPTAVGIEIDETVVQSRHRDRVVVTDFLTDASGQAFDTIIGNPPYIAGTKSDTNIFAKFIEKSFDRLSIGGELIFIVPVSIFTSSSSAKILSRLLDHGSITDVKYRLGPLEWDAAVEVCVFRYEKSKMSSTCLVDCVRRNVVSNGGFVYLVDYQASAFMSDFFKVKVGCAARKADISTDGTGIPIYNFGSNTLTYIKHGCVWPRWVAPVPGRKILVHSGPTRRLDVFEVSTEETYSCHALLPTSNIDLDAATKALNEFDKWGQLGMRLAGRWGSQCKRLQHAPLPADLVSKFIKEKRCI